MLTIKGIWKKHVRRNSTRSLQTHATNTHGVILINNLSAAVMGPVLERRGPMAVLLFSSTMFWLGHMIAALGAWQKIMGLIYFGYGVVAGIGFGVTYITPVSPLQKWFPDYKGMRRRYCVSFVYGC